MLDLPQQGQRSAERNRWKKLESVAFPRLALRTIGILMHSYVTFSAQCNQVLLHIATRMAPELEVMYL